MSELYTGNSKKVVSTTSGSISVGFVIGALLS